MQQQTAILQHLTVTNDRFERLAGIIEKGQKGSYKPAVGGSFCKKSGHTVDNCFKRRNMFERKGNQSNVEPKPGRNDESGKAVPPS